MMINNNNFYCLLVTYFLLVSYSMISLTFLIILQIIYSHFTNEESEINQDKVTSPNLHCCKWKSHYLSSMCSVLRSLEWITKELWDKVELLCSKCWKEKKKKKSADFLTFKLLNFYKPWLWGENKKCWF